MPAPGLQRSAPPATRFNGYEGGYGTHLLARDLTTPSLTIGNRGAFHGQAWAATTQPGLGLDLARDAPLVDAPESAAAR